MNLVKTCESLMSMILCSCVLLRILILILFFLSHSLSLSWRMLTGSGIPILSTITNSLVAKETPVAQAPVYRFVPEVGFANYNKVSYQPQIEVEVPAVALHTPALTYGPPPPKPTYGVPI